MINKQKTLFFAVAVFLLAANLRAAIIVVGPLVNEIGEAIGASSTEMGFIVGTLPMLAFALCSPFAAKISQRIGLENTILGGLFIIAIGTLIRSMWLNIYGVMIGTFILCSGIALGNVLLAAAIRRNEPRYIERMTAIQMISFSLFAGMASAFAIPLANYLSWQGAVGIWAIFVFPTLWVWWKIGQEQKDISTKQQTTTYLKIPIWHSTLAWKISLYTGIQSMLFYTLVIWLPSIISSRGFTMQQGGELSTIFQVMTIPAVMFLTVVVERYPHFDHLMFISALLIFCGLVGVWYLSPTWMAFSVALAGIGSACSFTLSLMLFALRGKNSAESAALSGMAQTVGYLVAGIGPVLAGWLLQVSGGWKLPIWLLLGSTMLLMAIGWQAGRKQVLIVNE